MRPKYALGGGKQWFLLLALAASQARVGFGASPKGLNFYSTVEAVLGDHKSLIYVRLILPFLITSSIIAK